MPWERGRGNIVDYSNGGGEMVDGGWGAREYELWNGGIAVAPIQQINIYRFSPSSAPPAVAPDGLYQRAQRKPTLPLRPEKPLRRVERRSTGMSSNPPPRMVCLGEWTLLTGLAIQAVRP